MTDCINFASAAKLDPREENKHILVWAWSKNSFAFVWSEAQRNFVGLPWIRKKGKVNVAFHLWIRCQ